MSTVVRIKHKILSGKVEKNLYKLTAIILIVKVYSQTSGINLHKFFFYDAFV